MRPFDYRRAASLEEASARLDPGARIIAGGTNLLDLMKLQVMTPEALVDITRLPGLSEVEPTDDGGLRIGALVPNADLAVHPRVRAGWPLLARALLAGASGRDLLVAAPAASYDAFRDAVLGAGYARSGGPSPRGE